MGGMEDPRAMMCPQPSQRHTHAPPAPEPHVNMAPRSATSLEQSLAGSMQASMNGEEMGEMEEGRERLVFSERCGRVHMSNVTVRNAGIDWSAPGNLYWKHQVRLWDACLFE